MPQRLDQMTNALKNDYGVGLKNAINNSNVVWAEVSRNSDDIVGEQAVWSVHSARSNSTGSRAEMGTLPSADRQRYLRAQDDLSYLYHTIKISGPAKHLTRNDTGSFVRAVEAEVKGGERDLKRECARQSFGQKVTVNSTLQTGVIGTLSLDPGATTTFTFGNEASSVIRHFFVGMQFGAVNPADGTFRAGIYEVASISVSAKTVTTTAAAEAAVASGDFVVRVSGTTGSGTPTAAASSLNNEINGLRFLVGTQDYANITAATNPVWNALTLGSSTTPISEVILDEAVEKVEVEGNGSSPSLYISEQAQRRKLASLLQAQKRYDGRELTLTSGWRGLDVARGALVVDRFCPSNLVFCLSPADIQIFLGLDFQWDEDDDGGVFFKALDGSDAIEARYKWYGNLEVPTRNSHSKITLAEPTF